MWKFIQTVEQYRIPVNDEVLFATCLLITFALSFGIPKIPPKYRAAYTTTFGIINLVVFCAADIIEFIISYLGCYFLPYIILRNAKPLNEPETTNEPLNENANKGNVNEETQAPKLKKCGLAVFLFSFGYIAVIRALAFAGVWPLASPTNMVFLLHCLKAVSFGYHAEDMQKCPSFWAYSRYMLFFPALWSGPFLRVTVVEEALNNENTHKREFLPVFCGRLVETAAHIVIWVTVPYFLDRYFYGDPVKFANFLEKPVWIRCVYLYIILIQVRGRFLSAWFLSEMTCVAAGVAYDEVQQYKVDTEIYRAYNAFKIEGSTSIRSVLRFWNCSVQTWLVTYVYRRIKIKNQFWRRAIVMFTSAFWHGVDAGYYFSFLLLVVLMTIQDLSPPLEKISPTLMDNPCICRLDTMLRWLSTCLILHFCATAFCWPQLSVFWMLWRHCQFFGIPVLIVAHLTVYLICRKCLKPSQKGWRDVRKLETETETETEEASKEVKED